MMKPEFISRRSFIRMSATGAGALCLAGCYRGNRQDYLVLTEKEAGILDALADQIIPPDDFAGGAEAGVTTFIDRQLNGFYADQVDLYRKCIASLDRTCKKAYEVDFISLDFDRQFAFLMDIQSGRYDGEEWGGYTASAFFSTLRGHCMQGYYGSPRHGGNRNFVGYHLIGLDYPQVLGRNVHR